MGTIIFKLEGDEAGAVRAFLRLTDAQKKAEMEAMKLGLAANQSNTNLKKTGDQASAIDRGFKAAAASAVTFMLGFASLSKVVGLFGDWLGHLTKIREQMDKLAEQSTHTQEKVLKLADQMGDTSEAGLRKAAQIASAVAQAGALPDIAQGAALTQAVMSNIDLPQKDQIRFAKDIAKVMGRAGVEADAVGPLVEFMAAAGATKTPEAGREFLAKLDASLKASASLGLGAFSKAGIKGGAGLLALGMDPDDVFKRMVQSRATAGGSDEVAAEQMRQVAQAMGRQSVQKLLEKQAGKAFETMGWEERFGAMETLFQQAETDPAMRKRLTRPGVFEAREQLLLPKFFSAAGREAYERAGRRISAADWETVEAGVEEFRQSKLGIRRRINVETEARRAMMNQEQFLASERLRYSQQMAEETPEGFVATRFRDIVTGGRGEEYRIREQAKYLEGNMPIDIDLDAGRRARERAETTERLREVEVGATAPEMLGEVSPRLGGGGRFRGTGARGGRGDESGGVNNHYGDTYILHGNTQDQTRAGVGAPAQGVD